MTLLLTASILPILRCHLVLGCWQAVLPVDTYKNTVFLKRVFVDYWKNVQCHLLFLNSRWFQSHGKYAYWQQMGLFPRKRLWILFSFTVVIIGKVKIWLMYSAPWMVESWMMMIIIFVSVCRNQVQDAFYQVMHIDLVKIILSLENKVKTNEIVSNCQNTQGKGTLKYQILSLLLKHGTGANCEPLIVILKIVSSASAF